MRFNFIVTLSVIFFSSTSLAFDFPGMASAASFTEMVSDDIDFEGIAGLINCSGSLVRFEHSEDDDQALLLTNGHCVKMIDPGQSVRDKWSLKPFRIFDSSKKDTSIVLASRIVYATMTKTDIGIYKLKKTYRQILDSYGIEAFTLASYPPSPGDEIEIISGFWKTGYSCSIDAIVPTLLEGDWVFEESIRYSSPGCEIKGGTSGSPIIAKGTRVVIGVNNTMNEGGKECTVNNPCELQADGTTVSKKGTGYGQQTYLIYDCLDAHRNIDLDQANCRLPH